LTPGRIKDDLDLHLLQTLLAVGNGLDQINDDLGALAHSEAQNWGELDTAGQVAARLARLDESC